MHVIVNHSFSSQVGLNVCPFFRSDLLELSNLNANAVFNGIFCARLNYVNPNQLRYENLLRTIERLRILVHVGMIRKFVFANMWKITKLLDRSGVGIFSKVCAQNSSRCHAFQEFFDLFSEIINISTLKSVVNSNLFKSKIMK